MKKWIFVMLILGQISALDARPVPNNPSGRLFLAESRGHILYLAARAPHRYRFAKIMMQTPGYMFKDPTRSHSVRTASVSFDPISYNAVSVEGPPGNYKYTVCLSSDGTSQATCQNGNGAVTPTVPLAMPYVAISNIGNSTVSLCPINTTSSYGSLEACTVIKPSVLDSNPTAYSFSSPAGGAYNPINNIFYVTNQGPASVSACSLSDLNNVVCSNYSDSTFGATSGVALSSDAHYLYIANGINSDTYNISICTLDSNGLVINDPTTNPCQSVSARTNYLSGVAVNSSEGLYFFSGAVGNSSIVQCFAGATPPDIENCANINASTLDAPAGLVLSSDNTTLFAANNYNNTVTTCDISGLPTVNCSASGDPTFSGVESIDIFRSQTSPFAYIANFNNQTVSVCPLISNVIQPCQAFSDSSIYYPNGITVLNPPS